MQEKSRQNKRNRLLNKIDKVGESLSGVVLNSNPKIAALELQALGIAARVKAEGIQ